MARLLSERFGKIVQERNSISINSSDTSYSKSTQLDAAIPPAAIASLSSGEFVGMVSDNPEEKIDLKMFHSEIINNHGAIAKEEASYHPLPTIRNVDNVTIQANYSKIRAEIQVLVSTIRDKLQGTTIVSPDDINVE